MPHLRPGEHCGGLRVLADVAAGARRQAEGRNGCEIGLGVKLRERTVARSGQPLAVVLLPCGPVERKDLDVLTRALSAKRMKVTITKEKKLPSAQIVEIEFFQARPVGVIAPLIVELVVTETQPTLKGATATASFKTAKLETGVAIQVPRFVQVGDRIRVDTSEGKYLERVDQVA